MDNSNLNPQTPVTNTPPQPTVPQAPAANPLPENSNKLILWLVAGLVVIIILVGGMYLFLSRQQTATQPQTITSQAPAPQENLENDLNSINVDSGADSDFTSIDQDLQSL